MKVNATDADKPGTLHSQIAYSIVAGGGSMFYINQKTGEIHVKQETLDREVSVWLLSDGWAIVNHTGK